MINRWPQIWQFIWNSNTSDEKYMPHCFFSALYRTPRAMCSPHPSHHTFTGISKRTITMPCPSFLARRPSGWCYEHETKGDQRVRGETDPCFPSKGPSWEGSSSRQPGQPLMTTWKKNLNKQKDLSINPHYVYGMRSSTPSSRQQPQHEPGEKRSC